VLLCIAILAGIVCLASLGAIIGAANPTIGQNIIPEAGPVAEDPIRHHPRNCRCIGHR